MCCLVWASSLLQRKWTTKAATLAVWSLFKFVLISQKKKKIIEKTPRPREKNLDKVHGSGLSLTAKWMSLHSYFSFRVIFLWREQKRLKDRVE